MTKTRFSKTKRNDFIDKQIEILRTSIINNIKLKKKFF